MKIQNDFECRPISCGHVYEFRNRSGWINVTNYEVANGLFINLMYSDIGEFVNQDLVDEMNYFGLSMLLRGAAEIVTDEGVINYVPGTALFGMPYNKKMKMTVNSRKCIGLTMIYSYGASIDMIGEDPELSVVLGRVCKKLGLGMNRIFRIPLEIMVLQESVLLELERNRCRDTDYIGKRASQILHVLYRMPDTECTEIQNVRDNHSVDMTAYLMTDDLSDRRTVKEVCESEGVNEFWFINNFRRRYGMTPTDYVTYIRHIRSAALLLTGRYSVNEVSSMVGYSSKSMFLKAFRKVHGCNPSQYVSEFDRMIEAYPDRIWSRPQ